MIKTGIFSLLAACFLLQGCANPRSRAEMNQNLIRENEHRIASLEESVNNLNARLAQLDDRVYEVRTRTGQKTNMVVAPVIKPAQAPSSAQAGGGPNSGVPAEPVLQPAPAAKPAPQGRRIDPKAKIQPLPAKAQTKTAPRTTATAAQASGSVGRPEAGPNGQISAQTPEVSLPPADLPTTDIPPVPQGNVSLPPEGTTAIPIPLVPTTDISLPPETSNTSPAQPAAQGTSQSSPKQQTKPVSQAKSAGQGEQALYNSALGAARSGRATEGIRLFREYLAKYPNGRYAANADYWIGECLYSQGRYKEALNEFQAVNSAHPSHHKNADALLKAGLTLNKMGDKEAAAEKFRTLIDRFPNSEAARRARAMGTN